MASDSTPLAHRPWHVVKHMVSGGVVLLPLAVAALFAGSAIYRYAEHLPWTDSFLNAAMLLSGMGPVTPLRTTAGKLLAAFYALFAGLFFIVLAGVMLAPVIHHVLLRFRSHDKP